MKESVQDFALFGGQPSFSSPLPVGQLNLPEWDRVERMIRGIFERQYYTNHGPSLRELEAKLAEFCQVKHAICVTNATIGLMIAAKALDLKGKVITPAYTFIATAQSLTWAGLEPVFVDVDESCHVLDLEKVRRELERGGVSAILGVHLWGNPCHPDELAKLAKEFDVRLYFDSAHAFGCRYGSRVAGSFGELEVFSFHATKILNATEGGCITTNDDELAARVRNIRSSYGAGREVPIPLTGNGRMSEAQAGFALLSLEDFERNRTRNRSQFEAYLRLLGGLPGLKILSPHGYEGNFQYVVAEIEENVFGLERDQLVELLQAENVHCRKYFKPGVHRSAPYLADVSKYEGKLPVTERLSSCVIQFPSGSNLDLQQIETISALVRRAHELSNMIRSRQLES